ncbi:MAG TPA: diphthine synthase [Candidatus Nanoarchaeia archaeon]|nr:diphthine synthase [Candidatus Nanoarchaeia archaeon]
MLYFIGIGLNDEKDISFNGLEAIKKCKYIYLENYTSKLNCSVKDLEKFYKKKIILADREFVENKNIEILNKAKKENVAFLVIGDVFSATTHITLLIDAKKLKIKIKIIHNASILNAIGEVGLELYKFGKITSIPFNNENVKTPIEVFKKNYENDMHTLFLLDINENLMTINEGLNYLIKNNINNDVVGIAGLTNDKQEIKYRKIKDLIKIKFNLFPQCIIIPGKKLHFVEEEALELWK